MFRLSRCSTSTFPDRTWIQIFWDGLRGFSETCSLPFAFVSCREHCRMSTSSIISSLKKFSKNRSPRETLMARKLSNRTESASQFSQETVLLNCPNMVSRNSLEIPWQSCSQAIGSHSDTLQQKKLPNFDESSPQFLKRILLLDRPFPVPIFFGFFPVPEPVPNFFICFRVSVVFGRRERLWDDNWLRTPIILIAGCCILFWRSVQSESTHPIRLRFEINFFSLVIPCFF